MGATVSFELARRFEASGLPLHGLFVSARPAPSRHRAGQTAHLNDADLITKMRSLSGTDQQFFEDEDLLRLTLPTIRNDYKAAETYTYQAGSELGCPIHAYIGDTDPMVTEDEARDWSKHTSGEFILQKYTGGHFYLVQHQAAVLKDIGQQLAR
ncbi:surfactin synthase thioesterase subunit [Rhodococcus sp. 27YEA15]